MERMVTLEKAIAAIKTAAEEIPVKTPSQPVKNRANCANGRFKAEDFLSYSTILDVHLSFAHEFFSPDEQRQLLEALAEILNTHVGSRFRSRRAGARAYGQDRKI